MSRWLWLVCLCMAPAFAGDGPSYGLERPTDFALAFTRQELALVRGAERIDTRIERIGIAWREQYGRYARLGLLGGYSYLTQRAEPLTAGEQLDGYHAGLSVDATVPLASALSLFAGASYLYERTEGSSATQDVTLAWSAFQTEAGLALAAGRAAQLYAGVSYGELDGEERARGTVTGTRDLSADDRTGALAGFEVTLDGDGYVGVVARSGFSRGGAIYFGRRF